jgi:hypothetical protein
MASLMSATAGGLNFPTKSRFDLALLPLGHGERKDRAMTRSLDAIAEVIRNPKHPFPQVAARPDKPHKNRYERRKVKQYIQIGDWASEAKP